MALPPPTTRIRFSVGRLVGGEGTFDRLHRWVRLDVGKEAPTRASCLEVVSYPVK